MRNIFRNLWRYVAIALIIGILVSGSYIFGLFSGIERFLQDRLYSTKLVNSDIVIIAIDNASIQNIGQWPWPRSIYAQLLESLKPLQPKAVGIDVLLAEPSRQGRADDFLLTRTLQDVTYPVVMPVESTEVRIKAGQASTESLLLPLPEFRSSPHVQTGHVNLISDADGVVRTYPEGIFAANTSTVIPSFSSQLYAAATKKTPPTSTTLSYVVYAGPPGTIPRVPLWEVLAGKHNDLLRNKIILVGATAADLHDTKPTPVSRGTDMPGVEIQSSILNMLIQGYHLKAAPGQSVVVLLLCVALLPALLFALIRRTAMVIILQIMLGVGYIVFTIIQFERAFLLPTLHLQAAWIFSTLSIFGYRYWMIEDERRHLKHVFGKYVAKDVLEEILANPASVKLGGEEREVTVFFSDIRGFTTLSESTTPQELVRVLNRYFTDMSSEVLLHKGVLDKYIGDAIMAFWGAPLPDDAHADHALQASIAMVKKLKSFNEELKTAGDPEISIGIGLYTGPAIVGNVGSEDRFDYTVIGDTVNAASRLEGLNKDYNTYIILSETTKNCLKGDYPLKPLGMASVKGRKEQITIYTLEVDQIL